MNISIVHFSFSFLLITVGRVISVMSIQEKVGPICETGQFDKNPLVLVQLKKLIV